MKKVFFLFFIPLSIFAQTNTNVVNLYSTPKLGTIFGTGLIVATNVAGGFTNITVEVDPSVVNTFANSNSPTRTNPVFYANGAIPYLQITNGSLMTNYGWAVGDTNRLIMWFGNSSTTGKVVNVIFGTADPGYNSAQFLWNPTHDAGYTNFGGEMQITAPNIAIGPGYNSGLTNFYPGGYNPKGRRIQLGIGGNHRGWIDIHFDTPGDTTNQPMSDTLPLRWQLQFYTNSAVYELYPTLRAETRDVKGNYKLTLWKNFITDLYSGKTNYILNDNYFESWRYIDFFMGYDVSGISPKLTNLTKVYVDTELKTLTTSSQPTGVPTQTSSVTYLIITNLGKRFYVPAYTNLVAP